MCCVYARIIFKKRTPTKVLISKPHTTKKQEPHKRASLSVNGGLGKRKRKRGHENGPKAEKDQTERPTALGRRTREEI